MNGKFVIKKTKAGRLYFYLSASNGTVLVKSQHYFTKAAIENAITSVRKYAKDAEVVYEINSK